MGCSLLLCSLFRLQGKSIRIPSALPPYDNMTEESAFDNESGVSTDAVNMQDVDCHDTSVLSWSPPIWTPSCCHLIVNQQRAPHLPSLHEPWVKGWCSILVMLFTITLARTISLTSACGLSFSVPLAPFVEWKPQLVWLRVLDVVEMLRECLFFSPHPDLLDMCAGVSHLIQVHLIFQDKWKGFRGVPLETLNQELLKLCLGTFSALLNFSSNIWFPHDFLPHFPHRWIPVNTFHFPQSGLSICGSPWWYFYNVKSWWPLVIVCF